MRIDLQSIKLFIDTHGKATGIFPTALRKTISPAFIASTQRPAAPRASSSSTRW